MSLEITSKWAKKTTAKPKTVNRRLLRAPSKICKYCGKPIPKVQGLSVKTYSIKEFCTREHYMLFHHVKCTCLDCNVEFWKHKSNVSNYCPSCTKKSKSVTTAYKKKCGNDKCTHLIRFPTAIQFGKCKFCCLNCFLEFMGDKIRYCFKCKLPLFSSNGDWNEYNRKVRHMDCEKAIYFIKKLEDKSKSNYINYKESLFHDTLNPNTDTGNN